MKKVLVKQELFSSYICIRLVYYINLLKTLRFATRVILRITSVFGEVFSPRKFCPREDFSATQRNPIELTKFSE